jgi:hypothetical protein
MPKLLALAPPVLLLACVNLHNFFVSLRVFFSSPFHLRNVHLRVRNLLQQIHFVYLPRCSLFRSFNLSDLETLKGQSSTKDKCKRTTTDEKNNQTILSTKKCVKSLDGDYGPNVVVNTEVSPDVKLEQDMVESLNLEIVGTI